MTVAPNRIHPGNHHPATEGVSRDVEHELAKQRADKRRQPASVSPVQFHKDLLVGDDWSIMALKQLAGMSIIEFDPDHYPESVLDLGCGTGLWVIEAAKAWPTSHFVGLDMRDVQPDLTQINLGIECRDLSQRIQWVHADFRDPLPFDSDTFNLVRISFIGLEVPEDLWQELFEECARVLKPGGALELIEEDLLFPAGRIRKPREQSSAVVHTVSVRRASKERNRSDSTTSRLTTATTHTQSSTSTSNMAFTTAARSSQSTTASTASYASTSHTSASNNVASHPDPTQFVQEHAKLKRAWEDMLDRRFLCHKLLTVLPLYTSPFFARTAIHPTIRVLLPSPSVPHRMGMEQEIDVDDDDMENWIRDVRSRMRADSESGPGGRAKKGPRPRGYSATVTTWNKLHLARQVRLISACKEAIWEAYQDLNPNGERTRTRAGAGEHPKDELRDEFEREWEDWLDDMKDRMGIRGHLHDTLAWHFRDPEDGGSVRGSSSGSQRSFRSRLGQDDPAREAEVDSSALCRTMRGLVAWKAAEAE